MTGGGPGVRRAVVVGSGAAPARAVDGASGGAEESPRVVDGAAEIGARFEQAGASDSRRIACVSRSSSSSGESGGLRLARRARELRRDVVERRGRLARHREARGGRRDAALARRVRERSRLDRSADRHHLVGVHPVHRLRAEERFDAATNELHARRPADEDRLVELAWRETREGERVLRHLEGPLDQRLGHLLELGAREPERQIEVHAAHAERDLAQVHLRLLLRRERHLHLLGRLAETLERLPVRARIEAVLHEEGVAHAVGDRVVDVVAAEKRIARRREHLEDVAVQIEERGVEGASAEVVDRDPLLAPLAEAVRERRRRRLVQDAEDLEPGDAARHFGRRALQLVEMRGDGDDRPLDPFSERRFGKLSRALQDERADLRQRVLLAAGDDERPLPRPLLHVERKAPPRSFQLRAVPRPPEQPLHARDRVPRVDRASRLGVVPDEDLAVRVEAHHAREEPAPLLVGDDVHAPVPDARHHRVRGPEIDADDGHESLTEISRAVSRYRKIPMGYSLSASRAAESPARGSRSPRRTTAR